MYILEFTFAQIKNPQLKTLNPHFGKLKSPKEKQNSHPEYQIITISNEKTEFNFRNEPLSYQH
jgi:hypothetical protein